MSKGSGDEFLAKLDAEQESEQRMAGVRSLANDEEMSIQALLLAAAMPGGIAQSDGSAEDDIRCFNQCRDRLKN